MNHLYFAFAALLLLSGCAGSSDEQITETETVTDNSANNNEEPEVQDKALKGLKLNDGNKWKVDAPTARGMSFIDSTLQVFTGDDYKELGKTVKKELKSIIDNCSMQGEDHTQYHIIVEAMLDECKALKKGKSTTADKLVHYMDAYEAHFECLDLE